MYRQGDIILRPVGKIPANCHVSSKGNVLAFGEVTGHRHWINTPDEVVYEDPDGDLYIVLTADAVLVHSGPDLRAPLSPEEARDKDLHLPLNIKKGIYRRFVETDYDPFKDMLTQIQD